MMRYSEVIRRVCRSVDVRWVIVYLSGMPVYLPLRERI